MHKRQFLGGLLSLAAAATLSAPLAAASVPTQISRYTFTGPGSVNTWWIETPNGLVVIDLQRDLPHAREALAAVKRVGKPVLAVIVTHGHPDHYAGLGVFRAEWPQLVAYASSTTQDTIAHDRYGFNALLQQMAPGLFPKPVDVPDRVLADDETLTIDGLRLVTRKYGKGDANSMTVVYLPDSGDLFSGDLVLSGMHLFFHESASGDWLAGLERLARQFGAARRLHPGHGASGEPAALVAANRLYIETARRLAVQAWRADPEPAKTQARAATIAALQREFPHHGNPVGLPKFLELSTQGLFKEFASPALQPL
jgi:glyoxylase-like metal-dependent hydrolase (beta-lactamase superfamily II)